MYKRSFRKPDGRELILYARAEIPPDIIQTNPRATAMTANPHLRWHPLRGEWVAYASYRQDRTFLPGPEYNPLAPTVNLASPTELPQGVYDIAVFENRFPSLIGEACDPPSSIVDTMPGNGICEVVVFTQDPNSTLGRLPLEHIELLVQVWGDRYRALGERPYIKYVFPFENRGVEVGVTLHHPHGQIYAYPFIPPIAGRELEQQQKYFFEHGQGLIEDLIGAEIKDRRRLLYVGEHVIAFVPVCARYPYEAWIAPRRAAPSIADLDPNEVADFARALKTVLLKYDGLWGKPFPYVMVFHQAPTDGLNHPEAHIHVEFYPPLRDRERLKYLAGTEIGAGMFANDSIPEEKARELQAVEVSIDTVQS